jgi:hypothetical protein
VTECSLRVVTRFAFLRVDRISHPIIGIG